jgi:hypothetical protein
MKRIRMVYGKSVENFGLNGTDHGGKRGRAWKKGQRKQAVLTSEFLPQKGA